MARGFLVFAEVHTEMRFEEFTRLVEISVNKALAEGAAITLEEIRSRVRVGTASPKRKISPGVHLRDTFQIFIRRRFGGIGVGSADVIVWTADPNAIWQELGTQGRRRKTLKSGEKRNQFPFRTPAGPRGVAPSYAMKRGAKAAEPKVFELIIAALVGVGEFGGGSTLVDTISPAKLGVG